MDKSEIKSLLKEARGLLQQGDKGQEALSSVRRVLKNDGKNYQALVLEGACLQQIGKPVQALQSYKKATTLDPKQLLAWQGIVSHYEKAKVKEHEDLIEAHKRISKYYENDDDKSKYVESTLKFVGQLQSQKLFAQCVKVLQRLIKSNGTNVKISQMTVSIVGQMGTLEPDEEKLYLLCAGNLHETESATDEQYRKYFQLLYKSRSFETLETVCRDLNSRFNSFYYPLDYLVRLYVENQLSEEGAELIPSFVEKLFKIYPSSSFGHFAQGKILYEQSLFLDAIGWLRQGTESKFHEEAVYLLILCFEKIWDFDGVEEYCLKILKDATIKDSNRFFLSLANSYIWQKKYKEAQHVVDKLPDEHSLLTLKTLISWGEGRFEEFETLRQTLREEDWRVELCHILWSKKNHLDLIEKYSDNFDLLLSCGIELLKTSNFDEAIEVFHKCLGLFKNHPVLLSYLAQLFIEEEEYDRALFHLQAAYKSLPSPEIGMRLSDLYFKMGDNEANIDLLKKATKRSKKTKSKWAWLRLGMLYLRMSDPGAAVYALQSAIRTDYSDYHVWETLAEAYYARGSYDPSLKAFQQCLKQGAEPTYPKFKIGVIQRHLGEEEEAIATLSELPGYSPALVELSKTWLQIGLKKSEEGLNIAVIKAVNECIQAAAKVLSSSEQILGLTIITEATIIAADLHRSSIFSIPTILLHKGGNAEEFENISLERIMRLGLTTCMAVCKNCDSKHVIAYQHYAMAKIYHKMSINISLETMEKAVYHAKKAVSCNQSNYSYWNSLGIIAEAAGEKSLALHAYLKSIEKNPTGSAATWTNLGLLLRTNGDNVSGHYCFSQAQRFEPSYGLSWIGQGLVAEQYQTSLDEATDLFRHAAGLEDTEIQGSLCYAYWVCRTILSPTHKHDHHYTYTIEHLDAVDVALEKITLFNVRRPTAASLNIQGILQAKIGLYQSALKTFQTAALLSNADTERRALESNEIASLKALGRFENIIRKTQRYKKFEFQTLASQALALEKVGNLKDAYEAYGTLVESSRTDLEKSNALISQGLVSYHLHGLERAKTLLFQGCESASSPEGYIALCSLALVANDLHLADSIVAKMIEKFHKQKYIHSIALMKSFSLVASGAKDGAALRGILSFLHKYPRSGKLWTVLANHFINFHAQGAMGRRALLSACLLGEALTHPPIALTYLLEANYEKALKEAQNAVLHNPTNIASLAIMVAALSARQCEDGSTKDVQHSVKLAEAALKISFSSKDKDLHHEKLHEWLESFGTQFA